MAGVDPLEARRAYERDVRQLATLARQMLVAGTPEEAVARTLVAHRNALKARYRAMDDPELVRLMALRNLKKYGDPLGPGADDLFARYGSWQGVIEAAARPASTGLT